VRDPACHLFAYAVPTDAALSAIRALGMPVLEIGAGTGYWAAVLQQRGVAVTAYDVAPPSPNMALAPDAGMNAYHAGVPCWTEVKQGGASVAAHRPPNRPSGVDLAPTSSTSSSAYALMLCYPPPQSAMALESLRCFRGDAVVYIGEWAGGTATPE
jgi:hypothetical protein